MEDNDWHKTVLLFWYEELTPEQWYKSDQDLDARISDKFKPLVEVLGASLPEDVYVNPDKCLAAIICFDQFTRNIFRGLPDAFKYDHLALKLAQHIVEQGWDKNMEDPQKQFSYMPFMHAEDILMQKHCIKLFAQFGDQAIEAAQEHHDIIEQFGRYPHRNEVLGRPSTDAEIKYLKKADRFGQ